jgi:hypothetical protein
MLHGCLLPKAGRGLPYEQHVMGLQLCRTKGGQLASQLGSCLRVGGVAKSAAVCCRCLGHTTRLQAGPVAARGVCV